LRKSELCLIRAQLQSGVEVPNGGHAPGETVLLDVKMSVQASPSSGGSAGLGPEEAPDGGVDSGPPSP